MTKDDLVTKMAQSAQLNKAEAARGLDALLQAIEDELVAGGKVTLTGFGTFSSKEQAARTGRNPRTGEPIQIAARKSVKFAPGKDLKEAVK